MKNTILFFFAIFSLAVSAQVGIQPGFRAGANFARLTNTDGDGRTDLYLGGYVAFKFSKRYTLQPEINYSRQGGEIRWQGMDLGSFDPNVNGDFYVSRDVEIQYIGLSVTNKFYLIDGFHLLAGPFFDVKAGGAADYFDVDMGIYGGIGYTFPIGISVEARFKQGLIDIFGNDYNDGDYDDDYEDDLYHIKLNQLFQIGVSYTFDLKK